MIEWLYEAFLPVLLIAVSVATVAALFRGSIRRDPVWRLVAVAVAIASTIAWWLSWPGDAVREIVSWIWTAIGDIIHWLWIAIGDVISGGWDLIVEVANGVAEGFADNLWMSVVAILGIAFVVMSSRRTNRRNRERYRSLNRRPTL